MPPPHHDVGEIDARRSYPDVGLANTHLRILDLTKLQNLFEAHSFTGRGVMQSYGIASGHSERIVEGRYGVCDLSPLGRERFDSRKYWQIEALHI